MSIESAKAYVERMKSDEEFVKKVKECKDSDARMAFVKGEGFEFTADEIASIKSELNDDELASVNGGVCILDWNGGCVIHGMA